MSLKDRYECHIYQRLIAFLPASMLFSDSAVFFFRGKSRSALLQLIGAACLMIVVLTHVCEALHLLPWMHWGSEHSIGHYLDFCGAVLGHSPTRTNPARLGTARTSECISGMTSSISRNRLVV